MEMNPVNKAGCFAELLSALSAAIVTPDNRMYFNSGADTDRVRIAIQKCYSPLPDGKQDIANDVPQAIPYFCIEFRDYVPTITMGGSVFRLKNGKVNCFLHGQKLYTSPRVVDDDMLDAACEAYADMYDVEYIDGGNRDNRRACIKAALQAALEANR